ncbi:hypothetical protein TorRG33x02_035220 [Trema orientale]|uniref:Uncharacterized protein n=1 Tax=Trema orientale TaxID=63057 RepID=A0A2P5FSY6_TREOI|nr:hypothetical protein TorRG33x02_035220 [Trema orientale]
MVVIVLLSWAINQISSDNACDIVLTCKIPITVGAGAGPDFAFSGASISNGNEELLSGGVSPN